MDIIDTQVSRDIDFVRVRFNGQGGEEIIVSSKLPFEEVSDGQCVERARALLLHAANHPSHAARGEIDDFESRKGTDHLRQALDSPAVRSFQAEKRNRRQQGEEDADAELTRGLEASFPASDPVAPTTSVTAGEPVRVTEDSERSVLFSRHPF